MVIVIEGKSQMSEKGSQCTPKTGRKNRWLMELIIAKKLDSFDLESSSTFMLGRCKCGNRNTMLSFLSILMVFIFNSQEQWNMSALEQITPPCLYFIFNSYEQLKRPF